MENNLQNLDGVWEIAVDPDLIGKEAGYYRKSAPVDRKKLSIPAVIQEAYPFYDGVAWYFYTFDNLLAPRKAFRCLLQFDGVDYCCEVWLNEQYIGLHEDGEEPFEFDVTDLLCQKGNYLAVRVVNPYEKPIDGIVLKETPHRNKANRGFTPGSSLNGGGIMQPVRLQLVPPMRIADVWIQSDIESGQVSVLTAIRSQADARVLLSVQIYEHRSGLYKTGFEEVFAVPAGDTSVTLSGRIQGHMLWSFDNPFLYDAIVTLQGTDDAPVVNRRTIRFGFRDFRVINGYFHLNGRRIFLKSSHTGNNFPVGFVTSRQSALIRQDLIYAKACGFNTIRFIAGVAINEQLDLCDEIGLMVYEECYAGWCLADSVNMAERFDRSVSAMIRRDRNHPSVVIWGLLNETEDGPVFRHAVAFLERLRELDTTRLVLLGSGRWDCQLGIGSLSNPGSRFWECQWGNESCGSAQVTEIVKNDYAPYTTGMGDIHIYPKLPQKTRVSDFIRTVSQDAKPVFVSEYGHGSQNNVIQEFLKFVENGETTAGEDAVLFKTMADHFRKTWQALGFDSVYSYPEDFLVDSMRVHGRLRQINFDVIRANSKICGYNLTGLLDHGLTGEGLWTYWRILKPGIMETVAQGWAPLRWCLFMDKTHQYVNQPIHVEAVLANEDILKAGSYPVSCRIRGEQGIVWETEKLIELPSEGYGGLPPLAVPVLDEWVVLEQAGRYELAVSLPDGGSPAGGRQTFTVSDPGTAGISPTPATVAGMDNETQGWLESIDLICSCCQDGQKPASLILAGPYLARPELLRLLQAVREGASLAFLSPLPFLEADLMDCLPFAEKGQCVHYGNWLYHIDGVTKRHPIFAGLDAGRIMEADYYQSLFPEYYFTDIARPDTTICAAFGVGQPRPGGFAGGVVMGEYHLGKGKLILNALDISSNVGQNPVADRLLRNIIRYLVA